VLLLALVAATMISFWPVSRVAALLLAPYLAWVSFATVLTWAVWQANPELL
jgi:tryptophan-rich sensory protein